MNKVMIGWLSVLCLLPCCMARASVSQVSLEVLCFEGDDSVRCPDETANSMRVEKGFVRGRVNTEGEPKRIFEVGPKDMVIRFNEMEACPAQELHIIPQDVAITAVYRTEEGEEKLRCSEGCVIPLNDVATHESKGEVRIEVIELFH